MAFTFSSAFLRETATRYQNPETEESYTVYRGIGYARLATPFGESQISYTGRPIESFFPDIRPRRGWDVSITQDEERNFRILVDNRKQNVSFQGADQASVNLMPDNYLLINIPVGAIVDVKTNENLPLIFNIVTR